ncbi:unnamed protein product [Rotaria sp. Silwood1]|nr:unnamed protein product [Rotaria sp. Silwood1]
MATKKTRATQSPNRKAQVHPQHSIKEDVPLVPLGGSQRTSVIEVNNLSGPKKETISYNGYEYQLIPVEIPKEAEIGLVVGHIEGQNWVFIDEILPNGMIEMHGVLKEGDYLIQVGVYSLTGVNITKALLLIESAYDEGRNSLSFVAARQEKSDAKTLQAMETQNKDKIVHVEPRRESRARSFLEYENEEEEEVEEEPKEQNKQRNSIEKAGRDTTKF